LSDDDLLVLIRKAINESPSRDEGHRKVTARMRREKGVYVGRKRALRLMRLTRLLAPQRAQSRRKARPDDGTVISPGPDLLGGTAAIMGYTKLDGSCVELCLIDHLSARRSLEPIYDAVITGASRSPGRVPQREGSGASGVMRSGDLPDSFRNSHGCFLGVLVAAAPEFQCPLTPHSKGLARSLCFQPDEEILGEMGVTMSSLGRDAYSSLRSDAPTPLRGPLASAVEQVGACTKLLRLLPSFVIMGGQRCGGRIPFMSILSPPKHCPRHAGATPTRDVLDERRYA
jgi:hypothetical protein